MKSKLLGEGGEETFVLVFDTGDEVISGLRKMNAEVGLPPIDLTE